MGSPEVHDGRVQHDHQLAYAARAGESAASAVDTPSSIPPIEQLGSDKLDVRADGI
jgi:hypothetical protein